MLSKLKRPRRGRISVTPDEVGGNKQPQYPTPLGVEYKTCLKYSFI